MPNGDSSEGDRTGPWDVVLYLVKKFPVLALAALLLGVGVYGAKLTLEERNKAEKELLKARQDIEIERSASRRALDEQREQARQQFEGQRQKVFDILAEAAEKEKAAIKYEAEAKAEALLKVQDTLLTASERIQKLVLGQLKSMEDLEELRALTAMELKKELTELENKREEAQTALENAERKIRVARLTFAIDSLRETLDKSPYSSEQAIAKVMSSFEVDDEAALKEINDRISQTKDIRLRGSLEYALALKTSAASWIERFLKTLKSEPEAFGVSWIDSVFGCCEDLADYHWTSIYPTVLQLVADEEIEAPIRYVLLNFFDRRVDSWRSPLFRDEDYAEHEELWRALTFIIEVAKGEHPELQEYQRANAPDYLAQFDLAAAHVWAHWLATDDHLTEEHQQTAIEFLESWKEDYPVFERKPLEHLETFWMSSNLISIIGEYGEKGTSKDYLAPAD